MAQQSARRGWDNQGFPQCFEHARVIWAWSANSHTGRRLSFCRIRGRTDDSIRPRANQIPMLFPCLKGGVHRWKADDRIVAARRLACADSGRSLRQRARGQCATAIAVEKA
jgi:hypothetical protein